MKGLSVVTDLLTADRSEPERNFLVEMARYDPKSANLLTKKTIVVIRWKVDRHGWTATSRIYTLKRGKEGQVSVTERNIRIETGECSLLEHYREQELCVAEKKESRDKGMAQVRHNSTSVLNHSRLNCLRRLMGVLSVSTRSE
jgi:hypothetical protein